MCEAFEGIKEEGREEGLKEGLKEGRYKSWAIAAENMRKRGMNDSEIAAILGISEVQLSETFEFVNHIAH